MCDVIIFEKKQDLVTYEYNTNGFMSKTIRGNGFTTSASYDKGNRLQSYENDSATQTQLNKQNFTYDGNGYITKIQSADGDISYTYDNRNQLTKELLADGTEIVYEYDKVGNRTKKVTTKGSQTNTLNYAYNEENQLTTVNGQNYSYDQDGNFVTDGQSTYIYNELDQLIEVKNAIGSSIFKASYDEQGRRIQTQTADGITIYYYENDHVIYETDANNNITVEYTWDEVGNPVTMTKDGQTYYYHLNGHGDVKYLTDQNGNVVASYQYDAWGNIISQFTSVISSSNPYRYAGYRYDTVTNLYYLMTRYYNADMGRFITADKFGGVVTDPNSLNLYTYVNNNPVNYIDPSSHYKINLKYFRSKSFIVGTLNWIIPIAFGGGITAVVTAFRKQALKLGKKQLKKLLPLLCE